MQPKIYSSDIHQIPLEKIDRHAFYIIEKLRQKGFIAYLVGGSVRDLLVGFPPKDFDIATDAKPEEIKKIFHNCILIGRRFRLAHIRFGKKVIEVSTFRSGDNEDEKLIVRDNVWGSAEEDVLRRDFTINGLFYDVEKQNIIDYVGGFEDIQKKILRTIGKASIRFAQDPVRMIRLLKFCAKLKFSIENDCYRALLDCQEEIVKSSPARILEELLRMLESGFAKPFFRLCVEHGLLQRLSKPIASHLIADFDSPTYDLLDALDRYYLNKPKHYYPRALLLAVLIFPLFQEKITKEPAESLHLGILAEKAREVIDESFYPFFHIPKKMRAALISILVNQYRFTPINKQTKRRMRLPKDPFFHEALEFLLLRTEISPQLESTYQQWHKAYMHRRYKPTKTSRAQ